MASRLIVNADDFGLCEGVNRAVKQAHTDGVLTSATIMVGMSEAKTAIERTSRTDQNEDSFGKTIVYEQFLKQSGNTDWQTLATFAKRKTEKRTIEN